MIECDNPDCLAEFDPIRYRWTCPECGLHNPCCDGEPIQRSHTTPPKDHSMDGTTQ